MLNFNHFFPDDIFIKLAIIRCLRHKSNKRVVFDDEYAGRYMSYARKKDTGSISIISLVSKQTSILTDSVTTMPICT